MFDDLRTGIRKTIEILQSPDLIREVYYNHIGVPPRLVAAVSPRTAPRPLDRPLYRRTREADGNFTEHLVAAGTMVVRVDDIDAPASPDIVAHVWASQLGSTGGWQDDVIEPTPWIRATFVCLSCAAAGAAVAAMWLQRVG